MNEIITTALMTFGAGFTGASFSKATVPGQALDDIMTIVGFNKLHEVAEKQRAKRDQNIKRYKEDIAQEIIKIPEENIQEPPLAIVGPALEASKYYIEEEHLREMFAKIIATSMDNRLDDKIHPSYIEIIKQLSHHDALVLKKIKKAKLFTGSPYPTMSMVLESEKGTKTIFPLLVLFKGDYGFEKNSISINNLERLGILKISNGTYAADENVYTPYYQNDVINSVLEKNPEMTLVKNSFSLSNFGTNFINLCVD
ncbi:DUF4393 domain-containing protein [Vagococcus sp. PNs007]|uniref:DUF4393 domain-containing protein n=1 Tax=Vagococcus proximus TaxID=2991417 RepID=A0ABT5X2U6_9ENTE|nr:DUF4393 domain-containing protein [Vagococcus proximus]MDF0480252.1 DUF4393 domain-containing protein [Vagococcus proximus]